MTTPSPIEARQAAQLALALERGVDGAWDNIDPDLAEAIFALRPELAPPPRAGLLDELFDELLDGPFAQEPSKEERLDAAALADALDTLGPPNIDDNDVSETIFALATHRAPAPNLSIDDILDSVATGPFAPVIRITGEFPAEIAPPTDLKAVHKPAAQPLQGSPKVISLAERRASPPPAVRRKWWFPAAGVVAAAAAVLLFVGPSLDTPQSMPVLPGAQMAEDAAPASYSAEGASLGPERSPKPVADTNDSKSDRPQAEKRASKKSAAPKISASPPAAKTASAGAPPASSAEPEATGVEEAERTPVDELEEEDFTSGAGLGSIDMAAGSRDVEQIEAATLAADAPARYAADMDDEVAVATESKSRKRNDHSARPKREERSARADAAAEAPMEQAPSQLGLIEPALANERPDLHHIWESAEQLRRQGNYVDAARVLIRLANSDGSDAIAVDAAVRAARAWLVVGDIDSARTALAIADQRNPSQWSLLSAREELRRTLSTRPPEADRSSSDPG